MPPPCCGPRGGDADALVHEALADDDLAAVEEVLVDRVAEAHRHVRAGGRVDDDLVRQCLLGIDDGGQRVVVDATSSAASSPW